MTTPAILLLALGLFFAGGVYSLAKQGLRVGAIVVGILAVLAIAGGVLRL